MYTYYGRSGNAGQARPGSSPPFFRRHETRRMQSPYVSKSAWADFKIKKGDVMIWIPWRLLLFSAERGRVGGARREQSMSFSGRCFFSCASACGTASFFRFRFQTLRGTAARSCTRATYVLCASVTAFDIRRSRSPFGQTRWEFC